jgi:hypothetical protein
VKRVFVNEVNDMAIIHFGSHEEAKNAKENGRKVSEKYPEIGAIFFGKGQN